MPQIDNDDERILAEYKRTNSASLKEELIRRYADLVKYEAGRMAMYTSGHVEYADLVSWGLLGLLDAIERYNPREGAKFKTYARMRIKGAIIDGLRKDDRVPRSLRKQEKKLQETILQLEHRLGRPATDEELAKELNITVEELNQQLQQVAVVSVWSLDEVSSLDEQFEYPPKDTDTQGQLEQQELLERVVEALKYLPEREQRVIVEYYFYGLTLKEIGLALGMSESRISQLHTKALLRLRAQLCKLQLL